MAFKNKKEVKIGFQERPVGFKALLEKKIAAQWKEDTPKDTGDLRRGNKVNVKLDSVVMSNKVDYAEYVEKSGPRKGGPGTTRFFSRNANFRAVNILAREARDELKNKLAARVANRGK